MLEKLQVLYDELMSVNSKLAKLEILKKHPECKVLLKHIYNPQWVYGVTSDNLKKHPELTIEASPAQFIDVLDLLVRRVVSGNDAISIVNGYISQHKEYEDLIYLAIDRNLKAQIGVKEINKVFPGLIPEFKVQLASKLTEKADPVGMYASKKIDGLRCITIFDKEGEPRFFSRTGKEFFTLEHLAIGLRMVPVGMRQNRVLDGELCLIDKDGKEDFAAIIKEARKKDHTIESPYYQIFDYLFVDEFEKGKGELSFIKRYNNSSVIAEELPSDMFKVLRQIKIKSIEHFAEMQEMASIRGWEGLIIRSDIPYQGKRSNAMLKVKKFHDAEFTVVGIEFTEKNMLNCKGVMVPVLCMGRANIEFKGNIVGVGSGWSDAQRIKYYDSPNLLIGKTITVQFFEECLDSKTMKPSLRFPTLKHIYEDGRNE